MVPTSRKSRPSWSNTIHEVVHEFLDKSSIHGAEYVIHKDFNWLTRITWLMVIMSAGWGTWTTYTAYIHHANRPVDVIVAQTNLEGYTIPFPALAVCPVSSVRRTVGLDYIRKYLSDAGRDQLPEAQLLHVLNILQAFRFPIFNTVIRNSLLFNDDLKLKEYFSSINVTDLAIKAFPRCEDIFVDCFLNKGFVKCCDIFDLHFTNFGLCYSFNAYSSEGRLHCRLNNTLRPKESPLKKCRLESNSLRHSYHDLKVAIKEASPEEMVKRDAWFGGYYVKAFSPSAMPEPANGYYVSGQTGQVVLQVSRSLTMAQDKLIDLDPEVRKCWFPTEKRKSETVVTPAYSSDACLLECLIATLAKTCGCRPHMIRVHPNTTLGRMAICKFSKMRCYAQHVRDHPYWGELFGGDEGDEKCAQCWPACVADLADVTALRKQHPVMPPKIFEGVPASNVFLASGINSPKINVSKIQLSRNDKRPSNIYLRRIRPELTDKLGTYGGIAGLFLGIGALSVFETFYFFLRSLTILFEHCLIRKSEDDRKK